MHGPHIIVRILGLAVVFGALTGCGDKLYKVKGNVTFEGKPLPGGGSISFVPNAGEKLREAGGTINEDGTYELTTNTPNYGAMAGKYRVVIHQTTEREGKNVGDTGKSGSGGALSLPPKDRIPGKYADHNNPPLTAKVEAKNPNEINFQLKRD